MNVLISILLIPFIWATKCPINNNIETFIKHESDNTKYYKCLRDGTINEMKCAIGFEFNEMLSTCTLPIVIGATDTLTAPHALWKTTVCHGKPDGTRIPNYEIGCQSYYECTNGDPYEKRCAAGTLYDINKNYCNWPEEVNCICPINICPNDGIIEDDIVPSTAAPNSTPPTAPPLPIVTTTVAPPTVSTAETTSTVTAPPTAAPPQTDSPSTASPSTASPPTLPTATSTPLNSVTPPMVGSTTEEITAATTTEYCETCPTCEPIDLDECPSTVTPSDCPLIEECTTPNNCPIVTCATVPCTTVSNCPEIDCPTPPTCPPPNKKRSNFFRK